MISVNVVKQSNYPASVKKIKEAAVRTLEENGIVSDALVDISLVGREKMEEINKKYYKDEVYEHPIFTFPEMGGGPDSFVFPPDGKIYLGQIVINYPMAIETANEKNRLIDDVVGDLIIHGCLHLVGIHHT